jgi:putative FmdB family regulatory protein
VPTYDYECTKCGHKFEVFQKMTDKFLTKCPECKGKIKRLIGAGSGIIFKGSGFYQTDYKNVKKPDAHEKASDSKSQASAPVCPKLKEGCNGCK